MNNMMGKGRLWFLWVLVGLLAALPASAQVVTATVQINGMI